MAKIKMSSIGITNIIGKAGGTVYSKNKGGLYIKNFVPPSNPQTTKQQLVRGEFGVNASSWSGISESDRAAWRAAAATFPYQDDFGDTKYYSGFNLFMKMNSNLSASDQPFTDYPSMSETAKIIGSVSPAAYDIGAATLTVTVNYVLGNDFDGAIILQATPPIPAGRNSASTLMRKINSTGYAGSALSTTPDPAAQFNVYNNTFGQLQAGDRILIRVRAVSEGGRSSAWYYQEIIAVSGV